MDLETGERLRDMETGELPANPQLNRETGESELNLHQPAASASSKSIFRIPMNYAFTDRSKFNEHDQGRSKMSKAILFLLPTVYFAPIVAILLGIIEIILHIWAHKKNKRMRNKSVYYQSPLHAMLSEFCASCIDESMKIKITKMQDKRNDKFKKYSAECFRRIVT